MDNSQVLRLLGRIEQADEGAFRELYCAFSRKLYAYVLRQLSDTAQAEEIVADTLYEVWKAPTRFRGESQFSTWLIGIARNKVLMHWRGRKPDADHDDVADLAEQLASDAPGAFELMAQAQRSDGVRGCVDKLKADFRECIHLVFFEGMALADVARIQQIPEGTVKTRLFHARQKLKQCLQRMLAREGDAPLGDAV